MKNILFFLFVFTLVAPLGLEAQEDLNNSSSRFVMARGGLSMRQSHQLDSKRMMVMPYGSKVEILETANVKFNIENIEAGMVKLKYNDKIGYAYEGYLSRYPGPRIPNEFEAYVNLIRKKSKSAIYEYGKKDLDGIIIMKKKVVFLDANWLEAILAARELVPFMKKQPIPSLKSVEDLVENEIPKGEEGIYSNKMEVSYSSGEIVSIKVTDGNEGFYQTLTISPDTEHYEKGLMIELRAVAD